MLIIRNFSATLLLLTTFLTASSTVRAADCEEIVARHMTSQALARLDR